MRVGGFHAHQHPAEAPEGSTLDYDVETVAAFPAALFAGHGMSTVGTPHAFASVTKSCS